MLAVLTASPKEFAPNFDPSESRGAKGPDQEYFYCGLVDESQDKRFFLTKVFLGDNSDQRTYGTQFSAYVAGRYRGVIGAASCRFDKLRGAAMANREDDKIAASRENRAVIETDWRP